MKWVDNDGNEMKFFSIELKVHKEVMYSDFNLYNTQTGIVFFKLRIYYDDRPYEIETLDFFKEIKKEIYNMIMKDLSDQDVPYSYDEFILPFFRNKRLEGLLK